jgi:Zn ribbon nucleic-acid-binding protein
MTAGDEACPACGESDGVCHTSENGRFRIHCAMCGHSTRLHPDLDLAQRKGDH